MNEFRIFAHGNDFNPDKYLSETSLKFDGAWYKGEYGHDHPKSSGVYKQLGDGYNLPICEQEKIAFAYLSDNRKTLKDLANYPGITTFILGLQYQIDIDENVVGFCMGPSKRLMMAALHIGISPTFYVTLERMDLQPEDTIVIHNTVEKCKSSVGRSRKIRSIDNKHVEKFPPVLTTTSFLIEEGLSEKEFDQVSNKLLHSTEYSLKAICKSIPKLNYLGLFSDTYLDPKEENCFQCEHCGRWATNYEKPNSINGLPDGRYFEGMFICDQCECWKHDPDFGWADKTS